MKTDSNKNIIQLFKHNNDSATVTKVADDFDLARGGMLSELNIAYETWGSLNKDKSNVVNFYWFIS